VLLIENISDANMKSDTDVNIKNMISPKNNNHRHGARCRWCISARSMIILQQHAIIAIKSLKLEMHGKA